MADFRYLRVDVLGFIFRDFESRPFVDFNCGNLRYRAIVHFNMSSVWMFTGVAIRVLNRGNI